MRISDWSSDVCSSDLPLKGMGLNIWAPSRLPDVDQMARQAPWRKEHHVDSDIIARSGEARGGQFGGGGDAAQAIRVDREVRSAERRVGTERASMCGYRWSPCRYKKKSTRTGSRKQQRFRGDT